MPAFAWRDHVPRGNGDDERGTKRMLFHFSSLLVEVNLLVIGVWGARCLEIEGELVEECFGW